MLKCRIQLPFRCILMIYFDSVQRLLYQPQIAWQDDLAKYNLILALTNKKLRFKESVMYLESVVWL